MKQEHYYEVSVQWEKERKGTMRSPVLHSQIEVVTPPEFPNGIAGLWSPEHLFVGAINSCLMTTFLAIAENSKLNFSEFDSKAIGKLEMVDGKYMTSEVTLMPFLTIEDEQQQDRAGRVLQKAEANCLITNSIKSKIIFNPTIKIVNAEAAL